MSNIFSCGLLTVSFDGLSKCGTTHSVICVMLHYQIKCQLNGTYTMQMSYTIHFVLNVYSQRQLRIGSCLAYVYRVMEACRKFGEHERRVRVA